MKNAIMPKTQREFMKANIVNIKRINITCNECGSELCFDVNAPKAVRPIFACGVCGASYGIDQEHSHIKKAQELIESVSKNTSATFTFLCEEG